MSLEGKGKTVRRIPWYVAALFSLFLLIPAFAANAAGNNAAGQQAAHRDGGDEIRQQQHWFYGQRAYPYRAIPPGALIRAQRQASRLASSLRPQVGAAAVGTAAAAVGTWVSLGPTPIPSGVASPYNGKAPWSGRVTAMAHDPTNAAVAYLGAANGGVWKTSDSGLHWTPIFDTRPSLAIGSIAVDPGNHSTVYVGTGEPNDPTGIGSDSYFGAGIFKSTNAGATWSKIGGTTFNNSYVSVVVVQPGSSATVFAAVGNRGLYATSAAPGIYRSRDGGSTWTREIWGPPVTDLVAKPGTPSTWYAGFYGYGIWKSVDDGVTWGRLGGGLPTTDLGRVALAVTAANPARIYAAIAASNGRALGVWTSTNSGSSWTQLPYTNFCSYKDTDPGGQGMYDLAAAAFPANQNYLYVGGVRLQRWNGSTWTTLGYDGVHASGIHVDIHSVSFDRQNRLWVGSDGGAYRKDPGTNDLTGFANLNNTLGITQFYPGISGTVGGTLLGGTQDNGSLQRTGTGWYELESGDGGYTALDSAHSYKFTTYVRATVYRDPGGVLVFSVTDPSLFIAPLVQSPSNSATLYVGTNRIWKTANDGSSWRAVSPQYSGYKVSAISQAKSNPSVLYGGWSKIATNQAGAVFVAVSKDGGASWPGTQALPNRFITDIAVKNSAPNVAWVTLSGYNTGHVFLTQNYGASWTNISGNLPNTPVNGIEVDSRTSPSTLYAATDTGVFESADGGTTWVNASGALPHTVVMDIRLDQASNTLIAATHGRGIWTAHVSSP